MRQLARRLDSGRARAHRLYRRCRRRGGRRQLSSTVSKSRAVFFTATIRTRSSRCCAPATASSSGRAASAGGRRTSRSCRARASSRRASPARAAERYFSRRGFGLGDYYRSAGGSSTAAATARHRACSTRSRSRPRCCSGSCSRRGRAFQLERWSSRLWDNKVLQEAFAKARQARAKAMAKAKGRGGAYVLRRGMVSSTL